MILNFIVQEVFYCDGRERADDEDFSLEGLILSDKQRKVIDKLDMNTQLSESFKRTTRC